MSSRHFQFKEHDNEGLETLEAIKNADAFNNWMYAEIADAISSPVLEIGSGIGNISDCCIKAGHDITLTDVRADYIHFLKNRFPSKADHILQMDLVDEQFDKKFEAYFEKFNTVFALNVIEHIEDDKKAITNALKLLNPGGQLIILVPAHSILYNKLDKNLFHFKRYSKKSLSQLMNTKGITMAGMKSFNGLGVLAWIYGGLFVKKGVIGGGDMKLYNKLVPLAKLIDKVTFYKIGLSLIAVSKKSEA